MVSAARLLRALTRSAEAYGCVPELALAATRDWASALFVGARYDVSATLDSGPATERWIARLGEIDLPMPRQFAREVRVIARDDADERVALTIEALVLED